MKIKNCANFILKVSANMECHAPITIQVLTARITLKMEIATEKTVYIDTEMIVGSTAVGEDVLENPAVHSSIESGRLSEKKTQTKPLIVLQQMRP